MTNLYDYIKSKFIKKLQDLMANDGVMHWVFCVGYFNLHGWNLVENQIYVLQLIR